MDQDTEDYLLLAKNEITLKEVNNRDTSFHKCYFAWCAWLWEQMPLKFKLHRCPNKNDMYKYLKLVSGQFSHSIQFKEYVVIEFESISFARMNETKFREYVMNQISAFYTEVLVPLKMEYLQEEAEKEFNNMFNKLI